MSTRWYQEKKKEHYYREAKRVGYRARSAFKLQQIQQKFHVLRKDDIVVDLGAAPGGWSQVARELVGSHGQVIGVDLSPMKPLEGTQIIQGDMTDSVTVERLKNLLQGKPADVVISDMSPEISGNYSVDQARSIWLCEHALSFAQAVLKHDGHFVCKAFEGEDLKTFLNTVKQNFSLVKHFAPEASRKSSSEIYIIAKSYHPLGNTE
ncbi:MAG: RlmE family RNA methyltransferase [Methanobacteriota archaeon]